MDALTSWFLVPVVLIVASWGVGLLVERVLRTKLEDGLVLPIGFAASMVLLSVPYGLGLSAPVALALIGAVVVAGLVLQRPRLRTSLPPAELALAAVAAYAIYMAPVVLTGSATFAGYALLGDNAVHFSLVDHVKEHGSRMVDIPYSSYGETLRVNLGNGYPLGPHFQLASLSSLLGTEVAWLYQSYVGVPIALAVIPAARLLRSVRLGQRPAALGGVAVVAAYLPFSYALQGGAKELIMVMLVFLGAVFAAELAEGAHPLRSAGALGVTMAAAFTVYSTGGLPWLLVMVSVALVVAVRRSAAPMRTLAVSGGVLIAVFGLGAAVSVASAIDFFEPARRILGSAAEGDKGNLVHGLPPTEAFGIWLGGDFRFATGAASIAYPLIALAALLSVAGVVYAVRLRALGPLLAVGASLAVWLLVPAEIYIEAKLLTILSPALVLMTVVGCAALASLTARPALGVAAALLVAAGIVASDGLAYRDAYLAPKARLDELDEVGKRFAGGGPALLVEFEEYGKHFLRDLNVIAPFDGYALLPAQLREPVPTYAEWADLDEMQLAYLEPFRLIVTRRNPVASRPPASYRRVFHGDYYEVWRRAGTAPEVLDHLPLGDDADPTGAIDCAAVHMLARRAANGTLAVAERPSPVRLEAAAMERPPDWPLLEKGGVGAMRGGELSGRFSAPAGRYRVWIRGTFGRGVDVVVDGRKVGRAEDVQTPEQMALAGATTLSGAEHTISLVRGSPGISPGNGRDEGYQSVFVEPVAEPTVRFVRPARAQTLCGGRADWIELIER
jgi:hypothetical protein